MKERNRGFAGWSFLTSAVICGAIVGLVSMVGAQKPRAREPQLADGPRTREEKRDAELLRATKGLQAAAQKYRAYYGVVNLDGFGSPESLTALAFESDVVVRGLILRNTTRIGPIHPSDATESVFTDYEVLVLELLQGDFGKYAGKRIVLEVPGGRYRFKDGAYAEIRAPGFIPPANQEEFVMFLKTVEAHPRSNPPRFRLAMGSVSLFELQPGGRVGTRGKPHEKTAQRAAQRTHLTFLNDVYRAVEEAKQKGKK